MKGRKPKPTKLKVISGNPGKRPLNTDEPTGKALDDLAPPEFLGKYGRELWAELAPELTDMGLLDSLSVTSFQALCSVYDRFRKAQDLLDEFGPVYETKHGPRKHPAVTIWKQSGEQFHKIACEWGLTPASRSRIVARRPKEKNPFDELFR